MRTVIKVLDWRCVVAGFVLSVFGLLLLIAACLLYPLGFRVLEMLVFGVSFGVMGFCVLLCALSLKTR